MMFKKPSVREALMAARSSARAPRRENEDETRGAKGLETHIIGDAFDVVSEDAGTIFANIAQAYDVARQI